MSRGAYSDALSHFHAAVDSDPNNYMSYYKRATVYRLDEVQGIHYNTTVQCTVYSTVVYSTVQMKYLSS